MKQVILHGLLKKIACPFFRAKVDSFEELISCISANFDNFGIKIRKEILDESALEMFWFIDTNTAYGGRAALGPLFSAIFNVSKKKIKNKIVDKR